MKMQIDDKQSALFHKFLNFIVGGSYETVCRR